MYRSQNWKCDNDKLIKKDLGFKNISVILWLWILLVEEIEVPGENHRPVVSYGNFLSHNVVLTTPRHEQGSNSQL
jgi:hypothetical protein